MRPAPFVVAIALSAIAACQTGSPRVSSIPDRLTDDEFWSLSTSLSEPAGYFRSENLVSNEHTFQYVIPELVQRLKPGGVYLGVAPDQNFTYIVSIAPRLAFILDIRRGNLLEHLMYKAIIELSATRDEFVARLFSRPRLAGLDQEGSMREMLLAYASVPGSPILFADNLRRIENHLIGTHGFPLSAEDLDQLEAIYSAFFREGPDLRYSMQSGGGGPGSFGSGRGGRFPSYRDLVTATDGAGTFRSYLATESNYLLLKQMEERNAIVPVVGDFAGPKALRGVGEYIRDHDGTVSAFYVSNVEQYLYQNDVFSEFARNVATLPIDRSSTFIRSVSARFGYAGPQVAFDGRATSLYPIGDFVRDFQSGRLRTYRDLNSRSR